MKRTVTFLALAALLIAGCKTAPETSEAGKQPEIAIPECVITTPPDSLGLDPFYEKYVDVNGIPLLSSWRVPDSCLVQAHKTIYAMTCMLSPEVMESMRRGGARVAIMARYEGTYDIPEHHDIQYSVKPEDIVYNWDLRARGLGGDLMLPLTTGAEENVLAYQIDKYHAEDILIHEFSHAIHLIGILQIEPDITERLDSLRRMALAEGKWKNTYAATDPAEYWAECVQDWFQTNAEVEVPDGKHNWVNTREELKEYDPRMYELISRYFPETDQKISKHKKIDLYGPDGPRFKMVPMELLR